MRLWSNGDESPFLHPGQHQGPGSWEEGLKRTLTFITKQEAQSTIEDLVAIIIIPGNASKQVACSLERLSESLQKAAVAMRGFRY